MEEICKLNVGGRLFVTTRKTLCFEEDSMLKKMFQQSDPVDDEENGSRPRFAPPPKIDGAVFLDRDPDAFSSVLDYLRNCNGNLTQFDPPRESLSSLKMEADFFQLTGLTKFCEEMEAAMQTRRGFDA